MRKETDAKIWWVALVSAVVSKAVDRSVDAMLPPSLAAPEARSATAGETTVEPSCDVDFEIADHWMRIERDFGPLILLLLSRHLKPATGRGKKREPKYKLHFIQRGDPGEKAGVPQTLGFLEMVAALFAAGAASTEALIQIFGGTAAKWRDEFEALRKYSADGGQRPLDTLRQEQLARVVSLLATIVDLTEASRFQAPVGVRLADESLHGRDDGSYIACGRIVNSNDFEMPMAAVCATFTEGRSPVGHWVIWPNGLHIPAKGNVEFFRVLPRHETARPTRLRLAAAPSDFCNAGHDEGRFPGSAPVYDLVASLAAVLFGSGRA